MDPPSTPYTLNPPVFGAVPTPQQAPNTPYVAATATPTPAGRGRGRGATAPRRARKPRGAGMTAGSQRLPQNSPAASNPVFANYQYSHVHWATPGAGGAGQATNAVSSPTVASGGASGSSGSGNTDNGSLLQGNLTPSAITSTNPATFQPQNQAQTASSSQQPAYPSQPSSSTAPGTSSNYSLPSGTPIPMLDTTGLISLTGSTPPILPTGSVAPPATARAAGGDEDGEGDDELLPAMADDDYSAQLSWQSQSKDNLKCVQGGSDVHRFANTNLDLES